MFRAGHSLCKLSDVKIVALKCRSVQAAQRRDWEVKPENISVLQCLGLEVRIHFDLFSFRILGMASLKTSEIGRLYCSKGLRKYVFRTFLRIYLGEVSFSSSLSSVSRHYKICKHTDEIPLKEESTFLAEEMSLRGQCWYSF
ncbi:hypothetical protein AVEN_110935-1 [Araneus ventricosus]|uniref:Uncharacterized protein n=1 Tax=Araneus ventricosus TaxID=182803 RepID=A0A4Y2HD90_ARAVE|nr:hypothetical protein AVEN_110935-1 [Araneus ventricosus]